MDEPEPNASVKTAKKNSDLVIEGSSLSGTDFIWFFILEVPKGE